MRDLIPWRGTTPARLGRGAEHPLVAFQREIERMFDDLRRGFDLPVLGMAGEGMISPRIDITETDEAVVVTAELPGLEEKDIDVSLNDEVLVLKGEKKADREEKRQGYVYAERSFGSFERRIPITFGVLADKVEASFKNGVLTVTLPKNPEAVTHVRRIPINVAAAEAKEAKEAA
jgi:HSP20 family protein